MSILRSRDNARVKRWRRLVEDAAFRRREHSVLIEGPHLVEAALAAGLSVKALLVTEPSQRKGEIAGLVRRARLDATILSDSVFDGVVDADTPQGIAAEIELPASSRVSSGAAVFLEGIQDPGNVGAILRSAAALGVGSAILDRACADPWSPKVLRAGMGGHFRLQVSTTGDLAAEIDAFEGSVVCTVARGGTLVGDARLAGRLGWIFGAEGRGVSPEIEKRASQRVTIPVAAGTESLNVAAAAAICFYEASRQRRQ